MDNPDSVHRALMALVIEWAWRVDHGPWHTVALVFTEDASFQLPEVDCRGREQIAAASQERVNKGRISRHVVANMQTFIEGPDDATGVGIVTVYGHQGPGMGDSIPASVFDFVDRYRRGPDGQWLIAERKMSRIFVHPSRLNRT